MSVRLGTDLIHAGDTPGAAVVAPIDRSANYLQEDVQTYADVRYLRLSNSPRHLAIGRKLATIEGAEAAIVTASGMAAISTTLLTFLSAGDHLLIQDDLYGGTAGLMNHLRRWGIAVDTFDARQTDWEHRIQPTTKLVYVEAVSNPTMRVPDLQTVVDRARKHGLISVIDNTFLSPIQFRPIPFGFDLVVHSATKYLGGHSDLVAGAVAGSVTLLDAVRSQLNYLGGSLDPEAVYLLDRGLKTLHLRVPRQAESAGRLAAWLDDDPRISGVNYPGLSSDPNHQRAQVFDGYGGMLSFVPRGDALALIERARIFRHAASLGGVESLLVQPARSSHIGLSSQERRERGIDEQLIRVSVGAEDVEDLLTDLDQALG